MSEAVPSHRLLKILGVGFGVAVGVGEAIGSGILRSPSVIAGEVPGVALILALWLLGGLQSALAANIFAELAVALPKSGGAYVYAHRVFGDVAGLTVGWTNWLAKLAGAAAASVSFAEFLPLLWPAAGAHKIGVAVALQVAIYAANIMGLREGRALQESTSLVKAIMLLVFIATAVVLGAPAEPHTALSSPAVFGWAGIVMAYRLILGAYAGWNAPTFFTGENVAPGKAIPQALFFSVVLTCVLYVGVNASLLAALGPHGVASSPLPFTMVLNRLGGPLPSILFALTALIAVASCANANIMTSPRILFAMAEDGLLPRALLWVNAGGSPVAGFLLSAVGTIALAMSGTFALVFGLIATLNTFASIVVDAAYFALRRREPALPRPFRAVGHPVLPLLALAIDAVLLVLFALADHVGAAVTVAMVLLCIPFAMLVRR